MSRIFLSFASSSEDLARDVHAALTKRGATVFQFRQTARAGKSVWNQVYDNIKKSDYFVCLLCRDAIKSRPVRKEIDYADYCNTNSDGQPQLVPVLIEDLEPEKWPPPLQVLTPLDLSAQYGSSKMAPCVDRIVTALGLEEGKIPDAVVEKNAEGRKRAAATAFREPATSFTPIVKVPMAAKFTQSDAEFRNRLESSYGGFDWEKLWYAAVVLILGFALAYGAVFLSAIGLEYLGGVLARYRTTPGVPLNVLDWVARTEWFHWASALVVGIVIVVTSWTIASDAVPIDTADFAGVTIGSAITAVMIASIWAVLHIWQFDIDLLSKLAGAAVALSAATVTVYALVEG